MKEKVFGFTEDELVEMFEPLSEFEEKVNDKLFKYGIGTFLSDADYKMNCCAWIEDKLEKSRMNKADKAYIVEMISALIGMVFNAGMVYQIKEIGEMDQAVEQMVEVKILKNQKEVEE